MKKHHYTNSLEWTGNEGEGTKSYRSYNRNHVICIDGKQHPIMGSSDPSFSGDRSRYNPEELFLSSISSCHMLWYLHLCSVHKIIVTEYLDQATGIMEEDERGSGQFMEVTLYPKVKVAESGMIHKAQELHKEANKMCFIANSCNFKIGHKPKTLVN
ncbi:OsmC family protein [Cryomorphaceae bacterium 1068]|nr:OsmC family protein [Cryomorphaceae bacterium 1068]